MLYRSLMQSIQACLIKIYKIILNVWLNVNIKTLSHVKLQKQERLPVIGSSKFFVFPYTVLPKFYLLVVLKFYYDYVYYLLSHWISLEIVQNNEIWSAIRRILVKTVFFRDIDIITAAQKTESLFMSSRLWRNVQFYYMLLKRYGRTNLSFGTLIVFNFINFFSIWGSRLNWFNRVNKKFNFVLIALDTSLLIISGYVICIYFNLPGWDEQINLIKYLCFGAFFAISEPLGEFIPLLSSKTGTITDWVASLNLYNNYYNTAYLKDTVTFYLLPPPGPGQKNILSVISHYLTIFYLIHLYFFLVSVQQLRTVLFFYNQLYLESSFQIPLFAKIAAVYNLNPYEENYYKVFLSHIINKNWRNEKKKKVYFVLSHNVNKDLFGHPRIVLKYQMGQLKLLKYSKRVQVVNIILLISFFFSFFFFPLFTCLVLWNAALFSQWFLYRAMIYSDLSYLDLIRLKIKMMDWQLLAGPVTAEVSDLRGIFNNSSFFKSLTAQLFELKKKIQQYLLYPNPIDEMYWMFYFETHWLSLRQKYQLFVQYWTSIYNYFKLWAVWRFVFEFLYENLLSILIVCCWGIIFILKTAKAKRCIRLRRKTQCFCGRLTNDLVEIDSGQLKKTIFEGFTIRRVMSFCSRVGLGLSKFLRDQVVLCLQKSYVFVNYYSLSNIRQLYKLEKECVFFFPQFFKRREDRFGSVERNSWCWHTDIVEHKDGTFYKIIKIEDGKIYGAELQYFNLESEKSYYYGKEFLHVWDIGRFFLYFPLLNPEIFWFEYYLPQKARDLKWSKEEILVNEEKEFRRKNARAFQEATGQEFPPGYERIPRYFINPLKIDLYFSKIKCLQHLQLFYQVLGTEEFDAYDFFGSIPPIYDEICYDADDLGSETKEEWRLKKTAQSPDEQPENTYVYWADEIPDRFMELGTNEFYELFQFDRGKSSELFFDRRGTEEYEPNVSMREDIDEGDEDFFPLPPQLSYHSDVLENEQDFLEHEAEWIMVTDAQLTISEDEGPYDEDFDYSRSISEAATHWVNLNMYFMLYFFVALCSILSAAMYYFYANPKQVFFFFFDMAELFSISRLMIDFFWLGHTNKFLWLPYDQLTVSDYLALLAPCAENIFGTNPTNPYGFFIHELLDGTIDLQTAINKNTRWIDLGIHKPHWKSTVYEAERLRIYRSYGRVRRAGKKKKFLAHYSDIRHLTYYLMYFDHVAFFWRWYSQATYIFYYFWLFAWFLFLCPLLYPSVYMYFLFNFKLINSVIMFLMHCYNLSVLYWLFVVYVYYWLCNILLNPVQINRVQRVFFVYTRQESFYDKAKRLLIDRIIPYYSGARSSFYDEQEIDEKFDAFREKWDRQEDKLIRILLKKLDILHVKVELCLHDLCDEKEMVERYKKKNKDCAGQQVILKALEEQELMRQEILERLTRHKKELVLLKKNYR